MVPGALSPGVPWTAPLPDPRITGRRAPSSCIRANLLCNNEWLRRVICSRRRRLFIGLPEAQELRLERLQEDFFELTELFVTASSPRDFAPAFPGRRIPRDLSFVDGMLQLVKVLQGVDRQLSRQATGIIDPITGPRLWGIDNPEADEQQR